MINVRTDLAVEANEDYKKVHKREIDGVIINEEEGESAKITEVKITNQEGSVKLGKPIGNYITIDMPELTMYDGDIMDDVSEIVGKYIRKLVDMDSEKTGLVVGLGNRQVTPDALGPKVTDSIMVTRHLKEVMPEAIDDDVRPVCTIAPGVLGITGIETVEIIKALVEKIHPDFVICIDALASRKIQRVNRSIQISDTGISPGAGVGNHRLEINENSLGVKVIAIGVPTVVHAATIANDSIDLVIDNLASYANKDSEFYKLLTKIDKEEKSILIKEILNPFIGDLIVTPKEVDYVIDSLAKIIAVGINIAIQPNLDLEEINKFTN
ncbi:MULTISPECIES: GPR endopeptidase [Clostridium]|uniref:GPR endopeptidase n=1 Tax=Clostridium TaxID=1485 RepID=UPI002152A37D|nr:GPR endopeptidase [Clostridium sp. LY3-2]MCR6513509.1 GPR endopeptidase [Clostridium sp. LY3-2]